MPPTRVARGPSRASVGKTAGGGGLTSGGTFLPPDFGPSTEELEEKALTESAKLAASPVLTSKLPSPPPRRNGDPGVGTTKGQGDSPTSTPTFTPVHTSISHIGKPLSEDDKVDALRPHKPGWSTDQVCRLPSSPPVRSSSP